MGIRISDQTHERRHGAAGRIPWLVPPRLRTVGSDQGERHASWLELFFDLVFVVAITVLSHELVEDHSPAGFLRFAGLFVPVYVAWQGYSIYADRFDTDDLALRFAFFGAMAAIATMAVLIGDVWHGEQSAAFALAYIVLRSLVVALYWRAWRSAPEARPLIRRYGTGYAIAIAIWVLSLAVPPPLRYVFWGVALVLDEILPPLSVKTHRQVPTSGSHVPERWGLFTLIVIGESVAAIALETAGSDWRPASATAALLGFVAVAAIWWIYFDRLAGVVLRVTSPSIPIIYSYAHLPLLMGLAAASAGLRLLIEHAGDDALGAGAATALFGGVALFLVSLIATRLVTVARSRRLGVSLKLGTVAVLLGLLAVGTVAPPLVLAAALAGSLWALVGTERALIPRSLVE